MGNNVTFDEMNELLDEINRSGGETWVEIDGQTYYTDWGYGVVAIEFFIRMLKNRKSDSDATLVRHNVAEDARYLIDDEVHRDCEYYVYLQLRNCIDAIDDDYKRLKADNAKLREYVTKLEQANIVLDSDNTDLLNDMKDMQFFIAENAKLRELLAKAGRLLLLADWTNVRYDEMASEVMYGIDELGVEVEL